MARSSRLAAKNAQNATEERSLLRNLDKARRGEPHPCTTLGCKKQARHRGSLCEEHYSASVVDKDKLPLHEGCPLFLPVYNRIRIHWAAVHSEIAMWIEENLEQPKDGKRDTALLAILIIVGWKGARGGLQLGL